MKTVSDSKGKWTLDKLPEGTYLLKATYTDDYGRTKKYVSNIKTESEANIEIALKNSGAIAGYVMLSDKPTEQAGIDIFIKLIGQFADLL